jgi:hypothetical protein
MPGLLPILLFSISVFRDHRFIRNRYIALHFYAAVILRAPLDSCLRLYHQILLFILPYWAIEMLAPALAIKN